MNISTSEITSNKVRGNNMDFSIGEITSKKYVEMTWKFVGIWLSMYGCNIEVESPSIRRGVPVEVLNKMARTTNETNNGKTKQRH